MKSVKKYLRQGVYDALNNNISVSVHDKLMLVDEEAAVCIGSVYETPADTLDDFRTQAIIDLEITHHQYNSFTHDRVDDIENEILQLLITDVNTAGFTVPGFEVRDAVRSSSTYLDEFTADKNTARTLLKIQFTIIHQ